MRNAYKNCMSATSSVFPILVSASLILAIGHLPINFETIDLVRIGELGLDLVVPIFAAYLAMSYIGKYGYGVGACIGVYSSYVGLGLFGAIIGVAIIVILNKLVSKIPVKGTIKRLLPTVVYPIILGIGSIFIFHYMIETPLSIALEQIMLIVNSTNIYVRILIPAVFGVFMIIDLGGPINKVNSLVLNALYLQGYIVGAAAKMTGGMVAPIGIGLARLIQGKKDGLEMIKMGSCFITETLIPIYDENKKSVRIASLVGTIVACGGIGFYEIGSYAIQGGLLVSFTFTNVTTYWFILIISILLTTITYLICDRLLKKEYAKEEFDIEKYMEG